MKTVSNLISKAEPPYSRFRFGIRTFPKGPGIQTNKVLGIMRRSYDGSWDPKPVFYGIYPKLTGAQARVLEWILIMMPKSPCIPHNNPTA